MPDRHIQNISKQIFDYCSDKVTTDFELNKELVNDISDIKSKSMRNKVAGRLVVMKKNENRIITHPKPQDDKRDRINRNRSKK